MDAVVTTFMLRDHERLAHILKECQMLSAKDAAAASGAVLALKKAVARHIAWEEQILFPIFEQRTSGKEHGPTAVMRKEHDRIKDIIERMHACATAGTDFSAYVSQLLDALDGHTDKEENVLYPWIDNRVGEEAAMTLIASMKAMPETE